VGDSEFFNKRILIPGTLKACCLYVFADAALDIGQELQSMKWDDMTLSKTIGWTLVKLGGIALMVKAFYSNSSKS
jgi:hypothetical protein